MKNCALPVFASLCLLLNGCGGSAVASPSSAPAASAANGTRPAPASSASGSPAGVKPSAASTATITIGIVGGSPSFTPIYVGVDAGLFQKHGVTLKLVLMTGSVAMAALLSGSVQIGMDGGAMLQADPSGSKLAFIGALQNQFNQFVMVTNPSITAMAGLKGQTVAGATPGSAATVVEQLILKSAGLDPTSDVKWIYAGTPAATWAALQSGQVQGAVQAWPYYLLAEKQGFHVLADAKKMKIAGTSLTLGVSRAWARDNPTLVEGFLKGLVEATALANTDRAKSEAAIARHLNKDLTTDKTALDAAFDRMAGTFPQPPYITKEAVAEAIRDEANPAVHQHKPEDYLDNGPLDAIVASGFTKPFASP